jgi:hypothetical protein
MNAKFNNVVVTVGGAHIVAYAEDENGYPKPNSYKRVCHCGTGANADLVLSMALTMARQAENPFQSVMAQLLVRS